MIKDISAPRGVVLAFAILMEEKLLENDHKEHWCNYSVGHLRTRLHQEVAELMRTIDKGASNKAVIRECADVANFALMIADNYERETEGYDEE